MQRVATGTQAATLPAPNALVGTPGFFVNAAPGLGVTPTVPGPDWFNYVQEELVALAAGTGQTLSTTALNQALLAAKRLAGGNVTSISALGTTTLTADNAGRVLVNGTAGAITIDLPAVASASGVPLRLLFVRTDATGNTISLAPAGADTFLTAAYGAAAAPTVPIGTPVEIVGDGSGHWIINPQSTGAPAASHGRAIFTTVGASSWTAPAGVTQIWVNACAGGGGGNTSITGGGGGGGAAILGQSYTVVPLTAYPTTVGGGGATGSPGATGGTTSLGTLFSLLGGLGGTTTVGGAPGGSGGGYGGGGTTNSYGGGGGTPFGAGAVTEATSPTAAPGGFGGGGCGSGGVGAQGFIEIIW